MAIIKHISVKGSNGGDALDYVLFKHNETTGEKILDGQGNPIMRDEFYLDGINCEPYSFAAECAEVNAMYGKNQKYGDVKAHHFIVSYDPTDATERELTGAKAQKLSIEFAERCFPGFQILVCTHMDGSNESGNIHTHLMMNSVRKYDTGPESYGERDIDHKAGFKLHLTEDYLRFMKKELMKICEKEGLYQVDLMTPAQNKINDKEYRVHQRGQDRLDNLNERFKQEGIAPQKTVFQTQKQYLRDAVIDVASRATSFDAFCVMMKEDYDIIVKESRGRLSYLHPDRRKYVTGRALGTTYEKESVIQIINEEKTVKAPNKYKPNKTDLLSTNNVEDSLKVFEMHTNLRLVVRLQDCAKVRIRAPYANNETLTNVKTMAETILFVQHNGFNTREELVEALSSTMDRYQSIDDDIKRQSIELKSVNEDIHLLGQYLKYKKEYTENNYGKNRDAVPSEHTEEAKTYRNAISALQRKYDNARFPVMKELKQKKHDTVLCISQLQEQRKECLIQQHLLTEAINSVDEILREEHDIESRLSKDVMAGTKNRRDSFDRGADS